jgi:hypothetical protein
MVSLYDNLDHLMVACILKTERHMTHILEYFRLCVIKESKYGGAVREFRFTLYMSGCPIIPSLLFLLIAPS